MSFIPTFKGLRGEYGVAYLPAFIYVYLYVATPPTNFRILGAEFASHHFYQFAIIICIIGGIILHKTAYLIFGPEGPSQNPKETDIVFKYVASFFWGLDFSEDSIETDSFIGYCKKIAFLAEERAEPKHTLRLIFTGGFVAGAWLLKYISLPVLYLALAMDVTQPIIGGALLTIQIIVILQSYVWKWFPTYISPEARENLRTPEYMRIAKAEDDNRQSSLDDYS